MSFGDHIGHHSDAHPSGQPGPNLQCAASSRVLKEWHAPGIRLEGQREEERLHSIYNELLLACARKRRMEDATFLLQSAERHGVGLSLHHLQVGAAAAGWAILPCRTLTPAQIRWLSKFHARSNYMALGVKQTHVCQLPYRAP